MQKKAAKQPKKHAKPLFSKVFSFVFVKK